MDGIVGSAGNQVRSPESLHPANAAFQFFGFRGAGLAEVGAARASWMKMDTRLTEAAGNLVERYRRADREDRAEIRQEIREFNKEYPAYRIAWKRLTQNLQAQKKRSREMARTGGIYAEKKRRRAAKDRASPYNLE